MDQLTKVTLPPEASREFLTNSTWAHGPLAFTRDFFFFQYFIKEHTANFLHTLTNEVTTLMLSENTTLVRIAIDNALKEVST